MKISGNYHTHTKLCRHAQGMPADYCEEAVKRGLKSIGFSDHTPLPGNFAGHIRMATDDLPIYIKSVREAAACYPELQVSLGLESDYLPCFESYYDDYVKGQMQVEYLAGSVHFFNYNGNLRWFNVGEPFDKYDYLKYSHLYVRAMESGLFDFMCHPDLFCNCFEEWNSEARAAAKYIFDAAESLGMALEYNTSGFLKAIQRGTPEDIRYPRKEFWEMASDYKLKVIIGADAHDPGHIDYRLSEAAETLSKCDNFTVVELAQLLSGERAGSKMQPA